MVDNPTEIFVKPGARNPDKFHLNFTNIANLTVGWPLEQIGAFFSLLIYQWRNRTIPWTEDAFMRIFSCKRDLAIELMDALDPFFFPVDGAKTPRRMEPIMERQREHALRLSRIRREVAMKGVRKNRAMKIAKERDLELARIIRTADELAKVEDEERKKMEKEQKERRKKMVQAAQDEKPKVEHPEKNPIMAARTHWQMSYGGKVRKKPKLLRADMVALAELAEKYPLQELKRRISLYIHDHEEKSRPHHFAAVYDRYAPKVIRTENPDGLTSKEADREKRAQKEFLKEFGLPKKWTEEESARRRRVVFDYIKSTIPDAELTANGDPHDKHLLPSRMLAALKDDRAKHPHLYEKDDSYAAST